MKGLAMKLSYLRARAKPFPPLLNIFAAGGTDCPNPNSLYWIGQYESVYSTRWVWFFQVDLIRSIRCCVLRFMGGGEEDLRLLLSHRY
jgi:hypothetical protein